MDESDPTPSNPLEKIFSKLTLAQRATNSIQRQTHEKLDAQQRRMEMYERKLDGLIELVRNNNSSSRIVIEKLSIIQDTVRNSVEELREIRRVFSDNQRVLIVTDKNISEVREDLAEMRRDLTPVHGVTIPTKEEARGRGRDRARRVPQVEHYLGVQQERVADDPDFGGTRGDLPRGASVVAEVSAIRTDDALADIELLRVQIKGLQQRAADLEAAHFRTEESMRLLRVHTNEQLKEIRDEQDELNKRLERMASSLADAVEP